MSVFKTPSVALLVAALILLPSAYAWVNIKAVWDPYSNTAGLKIAIVNEDQGATIKGKTVNVGKETVESLKNNHKMGWVFVERSEAIRGVKYGDYYAYIIIPNDFSNKLVSISKENPQKPSIDFGVNEKINAVAPKIAGSGASSITAQISQSFIKTVSNAIFSGFYTVGVELEKGLPTIEDVERKVLELEQALPLIEAMGNQAIALENQLPELHQKAQQVIDLKKRIPEIQKAGDSILKIEESLPMVKEAGNRIITLQAKITDIQKTTTIINEVETNLTTIEEKIMSAIENAESNSNVQASSPEEQEQLNQLYNNLLSIHQSVQATRTELQQNIDNVVNGVNMATNFVKDDLPTIEQKINSAANFVRNDLPKLEEDIIKASDLVEEKLGTVEDIIHKTADFARNDLPVFEEKVRNAADKIRSFQSDINLRDIIDFLKHDPEKGSSFLAEPVILETKRIFPIPNYGSAMTPLYTMLALWVGGTILTTALPVNVNNPGGIYKSYHLYYGRLLTFLSIGIFQAVIVALGNLFLLKVYVVDKLWFVLVSMIVSMVFVVIIYTLRSIFGNTGNGLAMLLLVFQMSSSGATFPVQMMSPFFQRISPYMPFTHAINILRETVGGMIWGIVIRNILYLLMYVVLCFMLALLLKKALNKEVVLNSREGKIQ